MRFDRSGHRLATAALLFVLGCGPTVAQPDSSAPDLFRELDPAWIEDPYWFDGTAEINLYRATVVKYGQPREAREISHIVVTEDHDPKLLVKADDAALQLAAGTIIPIEIDFPILVEPIYVQTEVRWLRHIKEHGLIQIGVEFCQPDESLKKVVDKLYDYIVSRTEIWEFEKWGAFG